MEKCGARLYKVLIQLIIIALIIKLKGDSDDPLLSYSEGGVRAGIIKKPLI